MRIIEGLPQFELPSGSIIAIDTESYGQHLGKLHRPFGTFASMQVAVRDEVYLIYDSHDVRKMLEWAKPACLWVFQNAAYDIVQLRRYADVGVQSRKIWDTMMVERNLFNGYYSNFALVDLVRRWLQIHIDKEARDDFETITEMTPEHIEYAARDAHLTLKVAEAQGRYINDNHFDFTPYWDIDEPCMWALLDMQPVKIDVGKWLSTVKALEIKGRAIETELGLNVYSAPQVKAYLDRVLHIHVKDTAAETGKFLWRAMATTKY
jgi:hypothetical protein